MPIIKLFNFLFFAGLLIKNLCLGISWSIVLPTTLVFFFFGNHCGGFHILRWKYLEKVLVVFPRRVCVGSECKPPDWCEKQPDFLSWKEVCMSQKCGQYFVELEWWKINVSFRFFLILFSDMSMVISYLSVVILSLVIIIWFWTIYEFNWIEYHFFSKRKYSPQK